MQNDERRKFASIFVQNDDALTKESAPSKCTKVFNKLKDFCATCTIKKMLKTFVRIAQKAFNIIVQVAIVQLARMSN